MKEATENKKDKRFNKGYNKAIVKRLITKGLSLTEIADTIGMSVRQLSDRLMKDFHATYTTLKLEFTGVAPKGGRPAVQIDPILFQKLCELQCTEEEIARKFGIDADTLAAWCKRQYRRGFSEVSKEFATNGLVSLRSWQFQSAKNGSVPMQIFLGKNLLGQRDMPSQEGKHGTFPELIKAINEQVENKNGSSDK